MTREDAVTKGRRLLVEGRVNVLLAVEYRIDAAVRGDSGELHRVRFDNTLGWRCSCSSRSRCSHLVATQLVFCRRGAA